MAKDVLYLVDEEGQRRQPELYENQFVIIKADQSRRKRSWAELKETKSFPWNLRRQKTVRRGAEKRRAVFSAGSVDDAQ